MALPEEEIQRLCSEHNVKSPQQIERYCQICGEKITILQWDQVATKKYCSTDCMLKGRGYTKGGKKKLKMPPININESKTDYVFRSVKNDIMVKFYPRIGDRRKVLAEHYESTPAKLKHGQIHPDKYLFLKEAAEFLGVARGTLKYWEFRGYIKPGKIKQKNKQYRVYEKKVLEEIKRVRDEAFRKKQESDSNKVDSNRD